MVELQCPACGKTILITPVGSICYACGYDAIDDEVDATSEYEDGNFLDDEDIYL